MDVFDGWALLRAWVSGVAAAIALFAMVFYPEIVTQVLMEHAQHQADRLIEWIYPQLGLPAPIDVGGA
ncbi:hypothetical protein AB0L40_08475 [Patulibacter sp. NPDC049589]|uniref:hypothetical protein n=1 Tax=Patulibacter sp. NPDC049589 TaxID=3154731 RepID=UPI00343421BA